GADRLVGRGRARRDPAGAVAERRVAGVVNFRPTESLFKPYGLAPDVRVHRTPQHVQFIQQPIKAGITGGAPGARRRRCQILLLMFFWGPKTGASCAFVSDKTFIFTMR